MGPLVALFLLILIIVWQINLCRVCGPNPLSRLQPTFKPCTGFSRTGEWGLLPDVGAHTAIGYVSRFDAYNNFHGNVTNIVDIE